MQKGRHATTRASVGRHEEGLNRTDRAGTRRASTEQTGARRWECLGHMLWFFCIHSWSPYYSFEKWRWNQLIWNIWNWFFVLGIPNYKPCRHNPMFLFVISLVFKEQSVSKHIAYFWTIIENVWYWKKIYDKNCQIVHIYVVGEWISKLHFGF